MNLQVILAVGPVGAEGAAEGLLARVSVEVVGQVLALVPAIEWLVADEAQQGHIVGYRPPLQQENTRLLAPHHDDATVF